MNYFGKFLSNFRDFYNEINAATLTGAIDVVVVERSDGTYACSPFHVRFGKLGVLRSREKVVDVEVNGDPLDFHMKLGDSGEAFFVEEVEDEEPCPAHLATSPIPECILDTNKPLSFLVVTPPTPGQSKDPMQTTEKVVSVPGSQDYTSTTTGEVIELKELSLDIAKDGTKEESASSSLPTNSVLDLPALSNCASSSDNVKGSTTGGRRRRKKRSQLQRKLSSGTVAINKKSSSSEVEDSGPQDEDIFEMEDIADPGIFTDQDQLSSAKSLTSLNRIESEGALDLNSSEWSSRMTQSVIPDFHFFSDTELSPQCSPLGSRPSSPVQSDSEFEVNRKTKAVQTGGDCIHQSWKWGELPTPAPPRPLARDEMNCKPKDENASQIPEDEALKKEKEAEEQRSMLSGMFSFMKKTKKLRHNPEGIYLDEINVDDLDPEVAALYFPTSYRGCQPSAPPVPVPGVKEKDEDAESGQGTSLPQSPQSDGDNGPVRGSSSPVDSDFEDSRHHLPIRRPWDASMSLCGGLSDGKEPPAELFLQSMVSYDDFLENPMLVEQPDLVVRIGEKMYNWKTAAPLLASRCCFQRDLPQHVVDNLTDSYNPTKPPAPASADAKRAETRGYSSWFLWGRSDSKKAAAQLPNMPSETTASLSAASVNSNILTTVSPLASVTNVTLSTVTEPIAEESVLGTDATVKTITDNSENVSVSIDVAVDISIETVLEKPSVPELCNQITQTSLPTTPIEENKLVTLTENVPNHKLEKESSISSGSANTSSDENESALKFAGRKLPIERRSYYSGTERYRKTLRLNSEQISKLNLKDGPNEVVFSVTTAYQGTTRCKCHIYKWRYDDRIVVSDIDGTITKSDVLGHILPIVGKDWAQSGVAQLFTKIKNNGYKLLYLSARAIGQAHVTREYLRSIRQGDLSLPDGPLLLNPTSLISALHREVIEKKPEEFKISCLRDIQALFEGRNPFYAGYGNKINDVWAYRAVGIPISRIFTINHRGELKHELTQTFQSTYSNQSFIVDHVFPPVARDDASSEEFNHFAFWREPIIEVSFEMFVKAVEKVVPEKEKKDKK